VFERDDEAWAVDPSGKHAKRIAQTYELYRPMWSPDSRKIAFGWETGDSYNAFSIINADGKGRRNVGKGGDNVGLPAWSPDGTAVARPKHTHSSSRARALLRNNLRSGVLPRLLPPIWGKAPSASKAQLEKRTVAGTS